MEDDFNVKVDVFRNEEVYQNCTNRNSHLSLDLKRKVRGPSLTRRDAIVSLDSMIHPQTKEDIKPQETGSPLG